MTQLAQQVMLLTGVRTTNWQSAEFRNNMSTAAFPLIARQQASAIVFTVESPLATNTHQPIC